MPKNNGLAALAEIPKEVLGGLVFVFTVVVLILWAEQACPVLPGVCFLPGFLLWFVNLVNAIPDFTPILVILGLFAAIVIGLNGNSYDGRG